MGMYDDIKAPKVRCPDCKEYLTGFQSKDGPCEKAILDYTEVDNFYAACDDCKTWVEFVSHKAIYEHVHLAFEETSQIDGYLMHYEII